MKYLKSNFLSLLRPRSTLAMGVMASVTFAFLGAAQAGVTDISSAPLFTTSTTVVKPNIMFVLDDSGSMSWDFMPDEPGYYSKSYYGRSSFQCNGVAYNWDTKFKYELPVDAEGVKKELASTAFLSASPGDSLSNTRWITPNSPSTLAVVGSGSISVYVSGTTNNNSYPVGRVVTFYDTADASRFVVASVTGWNSTSKLLSTKVVFGHGGGSLSSPKVGDYLPNTVYFKYTGTRPKLDYDYSAAGEVDTTTTFYTECFSVVGSSPGSGVFTPVVVTSASADAQNYANWYLYYRTRMLLMKSSVSRAFVELDDRFRVGFNTINEKSITEGDRFLNIRDFNKTQKTEFYSKLFGSVPSGPTPLRGALSKVGRYFAKQIKDQSHDPVQYSCQRNFTILSTDGYWNTGSADDPVEDATYGPLALNGSASVGQQDGGATPRPMYDGGTTVATTTTTWTATTKWDRTTVTPTDAVSSSSVKETAKTPKTGWQKKTYALKLTRSNSNLARCSSGSFSGGNCKISVQTSGGHGLQTGDSVTIRGANPAAYNGTFTITRVDSTNYTYTLTGLGSRPSSPSSFGVSDPTGSGCAAGSGKQVETVSTQDDVDVVETTTVTKTATPVSISTIIDQLSTTTPMSSKSVVTNGGTPVVTTTPGTESAVKVTRVSGPTVTSVTGPARDVSPAPSTNVYVEQTPWVVQETKVATSCTSTASAATSPSKVAATTQGSTIKDPAVVSGPTNVVGTAVVTEGPKVVTDGVKTSKETSSSSGGTSDTLADVAMYYYKNDLRTDKLGNCVGALGEGVSVCDNNLKTTGEDTAGWQHMNTFTLSLGASGTMKYDPKVSANDQVSLQPIKTGPTNWPTPGDDAGPVNIDDLWHAAINGRGQYFNATDPAGLVSSLNAALVTMTATLGSASGAATSTLQPVEGDNGVYIAQFLSSAWTGDLRGYEILPNGDVPTKDASGKDLAKWSAAEKLTSVVERKIYHFKKGAGNTGSLDEFTYAKLQANGLAANFENACSKPAPLSQCSELDSSAKAVVDSGPNMVDFLRGKPHVEYRTRNQVLGDIVNSSPVYVGAPNFLYTENGYATFKSTTAVKSRTPTLYVGANDGMLHAFDATNGEELWAYVPTMVMPNMYVLGDKYYESKHKYFVDASPVAGDIFVDGAWKTILVGGLNGGGRGYYALDVTDPKNPKALWEYTDNDLGLTFGNPVITKRKDGTWVVAFTSGYNNVSPGDGVGRLYVLNANTGALIKRIETDAGTSSEPSGLGKLNAWIDFDTENLAKRFYAGDLLGNVWRFDLDELVEPKGKAMKLAQLLVDGVAQPITVAPQLAEVEFRGVVSPVVYVGTGRYLGKTDIPDNSLQSIYAIKDDLAAIGLGDVRGLGLLQPQKVTTDADGAKRVVEGSPVDWTAKSGWYVDLASSGERVNVDMQLAFNTLTVVGNIPSKAATDCEKAGSGTAWIYQLNVASGLGDTAKMSTMAAGLSTVELPNGTGLTIVTKSDASKPDSLAKPTNSGGTGTARRSSWRELVD